MDLIRIALVVFDVYALIGVPVALAFVFWGVGRVDEAAQLAPVRVRLLLVPGSVLLWPVVLRMWLGAKSRGGKTAGVTP